MPRNEKKSKHNGKKHGSGSCAACNPAGCPCNGCELADYFSEDHVNFKEFEILLKDYYEGMRDPLIRLLQRYTTVENAGMFVSDRLEEYAILDNTGSGAIGRVRELTAENEVLKMQLGECEKARGELTRTKNQTRAKRRRKSTKRTAGHSQLYDDPDDSGEDGRDAVIPPGFSGADSTAMIPLADATHSTSHEAGKDQGSQPPMFAGSNPTSTALEATHATSHQGAEDRRDDGSPPGDYQFYTERGDDTVNQLYDDPGEGGRDGRTPPGFSRAISTAIIPLAEAIHATSHEVVGKDQGSRPPGFAGSNPTPTALEATQATSHQGAEDSRDDGSPPGDYRFYIEREDDTVNQLYDDPDDPDDPGGDGRDGGTPPGFGGAISTARIPLAEATHATTRATSHEGSEDGGDDGRPARIPASTSTALVPLAGATRSTSHQARPNVDSDIGATVFDYLSNYPELQEIQTVVQANPRLLQMGEAFRQLLRGILDHPAASAAGERTIRNVPRQPAGAIPQAVNVTPEQLGRMPDVRTTLQENRQLLQPVVHAAGPSRTSRFLYESAWGERRVYVTPEQFEEALPPTVDSDAGADLFDYLSRSSEWQAIRQTVQGHPQLLRPLLEEMDARFPFFMWDIHQHQAVFLRFINGSAGGEGTVPVQPAGTIPQAVAITPKDLEQALPVMGSIGADVFDDLKNSPEHKWVRKIIQEKPGMLQIWLQLMSKADPRGLRRIREHRAEFLRFINQPSEGEGQPARAIPQAVAPEEIEREQGFDFEGDFEREDDIENQEKGVEKEGDFAGEDDTGDQNQDDTDANQPGHSIPRERNLREQPAGVTPQAVNFTPEHPEREQHFNFEGDVGGEDDIVDQEKGVEEEGDFAGEDDTGDQNQDDTDANQSGQSIPRDRNLREQPAGVTPQAVNFTPEHPERDDAASLQRALEMSKINPSTSATQDPGVSEVAAEAANDSGGHTDHGDDDAHAASHQKEKVADVPRIMREVKYLDKSFELEKRTRLDGVRIPGQYKDKKVLYGGKVVRKKKPAPKKCRKGCTCDNPTCRCSEC